MDYSFFDSLIDAVFIVDENRHIKYCNEAAATLCQSSVRRLTKGQGAEIFKIFELSNKDLFIYPEGSKGKESPSPWEEVDIQLLNKDFKGKVQVAIQPFQQPGDESRWVVTMHDVTLEETLHQKYQGELEQREEMITELKKARSKLEDYSKNLEEKVEERTIEVHKANANLKAIMDSLGQGFLIFDNNGNCGDVYTRACNDILEIDPKGKNIKEVLRLQEPEVEQFEKWSLATFSNALPFDSMKQLAPQSYNHSKGKQISLDYFPIFDESEILQNIVLVATDKTSEFEANEALEKERLFAKMIIKLIRNRNHFAEFLNAVEINIKEVAAELKKDLQDIDADGLFRTLHTIEGEAGSFHAFELKQESRNFQELIEGLRNGHLDNSDVFRNQLKLQLRALKVAHKQFMIDNRDILAVVLFNKNRNVEIPVRKVEEFGQTLYQNNVEKSVQDEFENEFLKQDLSELLSHLGDVAYQVAKKQGKNILPIQFDTKYVRVYADQYRGLIGSLVHAFRNAVDHGMEAPEERSRMNKPEAGCIQVLADKIDKSNQRYVQIIIRDDGRGVDPEKIRSKLQEKGLPFEGLDDFQVIQQIFHPGFSSRDDVSEFSGRGVGMDAIKTEVEKMGGHIKVESKINQGTKITIEIPEESRENRFAMTA